MSQETIRAAERATGQVTTMSTYDPDSDQLHEECGIFGVWAPDRDVARLTYFGLRALQHRGQESAGIAVGDGGTVMVRKDLGLLDRVFSNADLSTLCARQQNADARFADAAAWSALLLPQVKDVIDTNASVSATLTERINAQLQKQQNTETSNAQTTPGSDGNAKQSGGLTQEQRKQVDDLLKSNQQSNSQNGSKGGKGKSSSNTNSTTKPW